MPLIFQAAAVPEHPVRYTEIELLRFDALFTSEPERDLVHTLLWEPGGSANAEPGRPPAGKAEVKKFLATEQARADTGAVADRVPAGTCKYGRKAVNELLSEPVAVGQRHGLIVATTNRSRRAGQPWLLHGRRPRRGRGPTGTPEARRWYELQLFVLAWVIANVGNGQGLPRAHAAQGHVDGRELTRDGNAINKRH